MNKPLAAFSLLALSTVAHAGPIQDNSFLMEEAYNQEAGVVQFIQSYTRTNGTWNYSFTNEIPLGSEKHQISYTIPLTKTDDLIGSKMGDAMLHYRIEAARTETMRFTPRLSVLLPTGDEQKGYGTGSVGIQAALASSIELSPAFVVHWNVGATWTPSAKEPDGTDTATTLGFNHGASIVWLASESLNFLVEFVGSSAETLVAVGTKSRDESFQLSPGIRYAINLPADFQVVPGVAMPIGLGPSAGERSFLGYLSIEGKLW